MKLRNSSLLTLLGLIILSVFVIQGCPDNEIKGTINPLQEPSIYWADVEIDTIYNSNPNLRWFSTDQDGLVIDYQYRVILASTVDSMGGAAAVAENFPNDLTWTIVHRDSATIQLYSSSDTSEYVPQYVFLRAMDEDSLFSNIIYKYMRRNNHPPTCYLIMPYRDSNGNGRYDPGEPPEPQWSLPDTTASWKGIRVAWVGKDSIDIEGLQPDFEWNIRVYGPFTTQPDQNTDTTGFLHREWVNPNTGEPWILNKELYLTNLQTGWYILYARNRDDAFVPSEAAVGYLSIYEPRWIRYDDSKPILIANHSWYATGAFTTGELSTTYRDSVRQFYIGLVEAAGFTSADYDWVDYTSGNSELIVQKSDLYNHKLVIALDTDKSRPFQAGTIDQEGAYGQYLDVGGMLWIIGRRSFEDASSGGRIEFGATSTSHPLPYKYMNLSAAYAATPNNYANAEFAGATSLVGDFPDLVVDTLHTKHSNWRDPRPPNPDYNYLTVPGVSFIIKRDDSQPLYQYVSSTPDTSRFHGFPVASRYDPGTYRTSYFAFPLYFIQQDQAVQVMQGMLNWFFEPR